MDKKKHSMIPYLVMLGLAAAIAGLLLYIIPYRYGLTQTVAFSESEKDIENPLTGFAPPAENIDDCEKTQLVYIGLTWEKWEPEEDVYDTDYLEETFHLSKWKEEHKHAVLRFLCDLPGEERHMDIPQWLYEKTADGGWYSGESGQGYSPDYSNEYFMERHAKAIEALAQYFGEDDFVSYVELGSLGHWGEWHTGTDTDTPGMPDAEICWQYVLDYTDSFSNVKFLMRRNYVMVSDGGLGVYNDMAGEADSTQEWLNWLENGGTQETSGTALSLVPVPDFWKTAPVGGELTSSYELDELLQERLVDTIDMISQSHMTFLGPKCPTGDQLSSDAAKTIRESMGYRFYISELSTAYSFGKNRLKVTMTWENTGLAPFYWNWPAVMYVYDKDGELLYWKTLDFSLTDLMPGDSIETSADIPFSESFRDGFCIGIGIESPDGDDHIKLAMDAETKDDVQIIYTYEKS